MHLNVSLHDTVKPLYLKHVDNWFLKLVLCYLNEYIFKNQLSTCSRWRGLNVARRIIEKEMQLLKYYDP
jgi:hypothetical protein